MDDVIKNFSRAYNKSAFSENLPHKLCCVAYSVCNSTMDIGKDVLHGNISGILDNVFGGCDPEIAEFIFLFSKEQSKGRGRRNRAWVSSPEGGMYLTIVDRLPRKRSSISGLSLCIGIGIRNALKTLGVESALKWPNDVLCCSEPYEKLSGVLLETFTSDSPDECLILSGIGVNINQNTFPENVPATSLAIQIGTSFQYEETCLFLVSEVFKIYLEFMDAGFVGFRDQWWEASLHHGSRVTCEFPSLSGLVEGVRDDGALLVRSEGRIHPVVSGDVQLVHDFKSRIK